MPRRGGVVRRHRRQFPPAQLVVVGVLAGVADADGDELGSHLVVDEAALDGRHLLEVPVAVGHVDDRVAAAGLLGIAGGQADVQLVVPARRVGRQHAKLRVGNRVRRVGRLRAWRSHWLRPRRAGMSRSMGNVWSSVAPRGGSRDARDRRPPRIDHQMTTSSPCADGMPSCASRLLVPSSRSRLAGPHAHDTKEPAMTRRTFGLASSPFVLPAIACAQGGGQRAASPTFRPYRRLARPRRRSSHVLDRMVDQPRAVPGGRRRERADAPAARGDHRGQERRRDRHVDGLLGPVDVPGPAQHRRPDDDLRDRPRPRRTGPQALRRGRRRLAGGHRRRRRAREREAGAGPDRPRVPRRGQGRLRQLPEGAASAACAPAA